MNIGSILAQTGAIDSIAKQLGVEPQVARTGAAVLLPAILAGMGRQSAGAQGSGGGLGDLVGAIAGSGGGGLLDLVLGSGPTPVDRGNDILGQIFGNKDVSRTVATEAAGASGMSADLLKKMLPLLAMAVAGYLAQRGQQTDTATSGQGDLGGLLGSIVGGLAKR